MKAWFIKNRDEILVRVVATICCVMIGALLINGWNMIKNDPIQPFDDGIEEIELTDEMVETYGALVRLSLETN